MKGINFKKLINDIVRDSDDVTIVDIDKRTGKDML